MNEVRVLFLVLGLAALSGCATTEESFRDAKLMDKIAYKFNCPKDQIKLKVLKRNEGLGCYESVVGVEGCGQRAVYTCNDQQEWVIDKSAP